MQYLLHIYSVFFQLFLLINYRQINLLIMDCSMGVAKSGTRLAREQQQRRLLEGVDLERSVRFRCDGQSWFSH